MYDKREVFKEIDKKLNEVRIMCNRARIPFIWVAAVYDDGENTEYKAIVDENGEDSEEPNALGGLACHTLTPGMYEMDLADDKIKEVIKVLNGCKAVPKDSVMLLSSEDTDINAESFYGSLAKDDEGSLFFVTEKEMEEREQEKQKAKKKPREEENVFGNIVFDALPDMDGEEDDDDEFEE